jgi:hypothetical protein
MAGTEALRSVVALVVRRSFGLASTLGGGPDVSSAAGYSPKPVVLPQ